LAIDPQRIVLLASALGMLALGATILALRGNSGWHRALGALIGARGINILLPQLATDARWTEAAFQLQPYFGLAVVPLAAWCLLVAATPPQRRQALGWAAVCAIVALDLAYWIDHGLYHTVAAGSSDIGALRAARGLVYTGFGPLFALAALTPLLLGLLGLRYAVWYRQVAREPQARTWLLLSAGLLVGALFDGTTRMATFADLLDDPAGFPWAPWGWAVMGLPALALAPAVLGMAVLAANRSIDPRPQHALEGNLLVLAAFACLSGLTRLLLPADSDIGAHPLMLVLMGVWRLAMPVMVAWALVLDARLRQRTTAPDAAPDLAAQAG
jgi:hypothetical protein